MKIGKANVAGRLPPSARKKLRNDYSRGPKARKKLAREQIWQQLKELRDARYKIWLASGENPASAEERSFFDMQSRAIDCMRLPPARKKIAKRLLGDMVALLASRKGKPVQKGAFLGIIARATASQRIIFRAESGLSEAEIKETQQFLERLEIMGKTVAKRRRKDFNLPPRAAAAFGGLIGRELERVCGPENASLLYPA